MTEPLEELPKAGDYFVRDEVSSSGQRAVYWDAADWLRHTTVENWNKAKFGAHVHFRTVFEIGERVAGEYCARFERPPENLPSSNGGAANDLKLHVGVLNSRRRRRKRAVLVPIGNFIEMPER